jgi:predicted GIY-YIG superfamily endonuclease
MHCIRDTYGFPHKAVRQNTWYTYIIRCSDLSLYCGTTTSLNRRLLKHNSGKGSKYVKMYRAWDNI